MITFKSGDRVYYRDRIREIGAMPDEPGTVLAVMPYGVLIRWDNGITDSCECARGNHPRGTAKPDCVGEWFDPRDIRPVTITPRVVSDYVRQGKYGTSYHYGRTINGTPYRFTFVIMASGERRHSVSKYNGYCAESVSKGYSTLESVLAFSCAWSPVHFITVPSV